MFWWVWQSSEGQGGSSFFHKFWCVKVMVSSRHLIQLLNHAKNYKQLYTNHKNTLSLLFPYHYCAALSEVKIYSCLTIQRMTTEEEKKWTWIMMNLSTTIIFLLLLLLQLHKQNFNQDTGFHSSFLVSPILKKIYVVDLFLKVKIFGKAKYDCNNYLYEILV